MSWPTGRAEIEQMLAKGELEQVAADVEAAGRLMETAARHLRSAALLMDVGDLVGAYQVAYDGLRKSAAALLEAQGLRATSRGGHIAVQHAVTAQFGKAVPAFRSFGRIRKCRNDFEYPDEDTPDPIRDDVQDAIAVAQGIHDSAATILKQDLLSPW